MTDPTTERPAAGSRRFRYIPAFDGLRGYLVIVGPLLFHARPESVPGGPDVVPGGMLSIDFFFVMSSFLIVSIALKEWDDSGGLDLVAFGGRRARRLLPAALLLLGFLAVYLAVSADASIIDRWTGAIVSTLTYTANWHEIAAGVSYFESFGPGSPLKHTWSLSIEEQFYLLAPLMLIGALSLGRVRGRRVLIGVSVVGAVASAVWMARVHIVGEDPSRAYYGTDTRAQALFVGIALAVVVANYGPPRTRRGLRACVLLAYPAMALHLWGVLTLTERDSWLFENGGYLAVAALGGLAMWSLSQEASWSPLHRLFMFPPLIYVGRISYGLYLYHWPIYLLVTPVVAGRLVGAERVTGLPLLTVHLALTFMVAIASYHLIEQPVIQRRWPFTLRQFAPPAAALAGLLLVIVALGGVLAAQTGRPTEIETVAVPTPPPDAAAPASTAGAEGSDASSEGAPASADDVGVGAVDLPAAPIDRTLRVLAVGDSVADQAGQALVAATTADPESEVIAYNEAHLGCGTIRHGDKRVPDGTEGPVGDICSNWAVPVDASAVAEYDVVSWPTILDVFAPDVIVTIVSAWDVTDRRVAGVANGEWTSVEEPEFAGYAKGEYAAAVDLLTSGGAHLYILRAADVNRPIAPQNHPARFAALNAIVEEVAVEARAAGRTVTMVDYPAWIGPIGGDDDLRRRSDGLHLTEQGRVELAEWLLGNVLVRTS